MIKFYTFLFLLIVANIQIFAQTESDLKLVEQLFPFEKTTIDYSQYAKKSSNELQLAVGIFFLFYKHNISAHDGNKCTFYPSCSHYAVQCIQKKGLIIGGAAASDRLSRCHPGNEKDYPYHKTSGLKFDPIKK